MRKPAFFLGPGLLLTAITFGNSEAIQTRAILHLAVSVAFFTIFSSYSLFYFHSLGSSLIFGAKFGPAADPLGTHEFAMYCKTTIVFCLLFGAVVLGT